MPPREKLESENQKRKRATSIEAAPTPDPPPQPPAKRQKRSRRSPNRTPPEFWDNLSQVPLTRRALREFNRRIIRPVTTKPPERSIVKGDLLKQLKRFARRGGPSLRNIRGYPEPEIDVAPVRPMSSSCSRSSKSQTGSETNPSSASSLTTPRTRKSTPYDAAFEQGLIDSGIYPYNRGPKPNNWEEIKNRLAQPRASLSPSQFSEGAFERFQLKNDEAGSEAEVMSDVFPIIRGNAAIPSGQNRLFNNFAPLNKGLADAKPDYYNGSRPAELDSHVRSDLGPYIVPSKRQHAPLLPNFFVEAKGPDGSAAVLKRQATQDIAYGARAMLEIQSYGKDDRTYDGNAYTIASTYNNGNLRLYAAHPTQPAEPSGRANYHMTQLTGYDMTGNPDSFRQGATAFRNMQGWAKERRQEAIAGANEKVNDIYGGTTATSLAEPGLVSFTSEVSALVSETSLGGPHESQSQDSTQNEASSTSETAPQESETSMDEPVIDANPPAKRSRHRKRSTSGSSARRRSAAAGAQQSEQWSWADGAFRCLQGQTVVGTQSEKPADVWVYFEEGWPGEGGKQWRRWLSASNQMEYR